MIFLSPFCRDNILEKFPSVQFTPTGSAKLLDILQIATIGLIH